MAGEEKTTTLTIPPSEPKPESPTTAHPLDFNDEPQEQGTSPPPTAEQQQDTPETRPALPPKPPRPLSPRQKAENTLKEAFPTIEPSVVRAVLVASGWNLERAFHALLGMTDPNSQEEIPEETPPPKPPRPAAQRQLEADELYARQLAEHYNSAPRRVPRRDWEEDDEYEYRRRRDGYDSEDREYSFFDDDLPVIRDNIRKGFQDTQTKVNSWVQGLRKKLEGEESDDAQASQGRRSPGLPRQSGELGREFSRRSVDNERYDADHQLLSDDFASLELKDTEAPPPPPPRPLANPNLYKSKSSSPDRRKVSFHEGPPVEIGTQDTPERAKQTPPPPTGAKSSKWQPLAAVDPSPVDEHDPFSLGDSDDEKDAKGKEHDHGEGKGQAKHDTESESKPEGSGK